MGDFNNGLLSNGMFMSGMGILSGATPSRTPPNPFQNMLQGMAGAEQYRRQMERDQR